MALLSRRTPMAFFLSDGGTGQSPPLCRIPELQLLQCAIVLAQQAHAHQKRIDGSWYVNHPLAVLHILMDASAVLPVETYIAAVLHDVLECDERYAERIEREFGVDVAEIVRALSKPAYMNFASHEEREVLYVRGLVAAGRSDPAVPLITLADRIHNLETSDALPPNRLAQFLWDTEHLYCPMFQTANAGPPLPFLLQRLFSLLAEKYAHTIHSPPTGSIPITTEP
ncbi:MAG: HD domain-containing protein [Candidatus Peregrinibacteria bacterium]